MCLVLLKVDDGASNKRLVRSLVLVKVPLLDAVRKAQDVLMRVDDDIAMASVVNAAILNIILFYTLSFVNIYVG